MIEQRLIYIDLWDMKLGALVEDPEVRSAAVSHLYERFTPFADEGWTWAVHPSAEEFTGWVIQDHEGVARIAGARLRCIRERRPVPLFAPSDQLSSHRREQLVDRPWTEEPGSRILRRTTAAQ